MALIQLLFVYVVIEKENGSKEEVKFNHKK
jgi:hypothetical protein